MTVCLVTSWDDGHPLDERLGELLQRHGVKGTFFVPIRNAEGLPTLAVEALRRLDAVHEIGSHTYDHCYLRTVTEEEARRQVSMGKSALQDRLGHEVAGFCYPGGKYDARVTQTVRAAGFRYARTVENLRTDRSLEPFEVPTTLQFYPHSAAVLARNLVRYPDRLRKLELLHRLAWRRPLEEQLAAAAAYASSRDGVLHIWGHSWELERFDLWGRLERFLRQMHDVPFEALTVGDLVSRSPRVA
ncbi:MAG: polysaccharide deacetylase family protein [Gammaproteobacteria bacterium]